MNPSPAIPNSIPPATNADAPTASACPWVASPVTLAGERIDLLPMRAAWWPAARTLIVADLHLGKEEAGRALGVPIPEAAIDEQLTRLSRCLAVGVVERVVVVGDLVHNAAGLTPALVERVREWRRTFTPRILVVPGNHDRRVRPGSAIALAWDLEVLPPRWDDGPFAFVHDPADAASDPPAGFFWHGHVHPAISLPGRGVRKLACFVVGPSRVLLPAMSAFTGGGPFEAEAGDRIFVVVPREQAGPSPDAVIEMPPRPVRGASTRGGRSPR